jgi:hypothetical protein
MCSKTTKISVNAREYQNYNTEIQSKNTAAEKLD